eukprot:NODE_3905_length_623_cov_146.947735_g2813_i0.p1 GENE.NODE_3905_length_623_cov_146.947735_g2813_i0~~NODE_3905_length_623_cov_146.947735_g2813_i0.p1  ORF type:complete len:66 (-),score=8.49 NODE_3905_length_623_cov_146.947735_g2813_i0:19-216(-)
MSPHGHEDNTIGTDTTAATTTTTTSTTNTNDTHDTNSDNHHLIDKKSSTTTAPSRLHRLPPCTLR